MKQDLDEIGVKLDHALDIIEEQWKGEKLDEDNVWVFIVTNAGIKIAEADPNNDSETVRGLDLRFHHVEDDEDEGVFDLH